MEFFIIAGIVAVSVLAYIYFTSNGPKQIVPEPVAVPVEEPKVEAVKDEVKKVKKEPKKKEPKVESTEAKPAAKKPTRKKPNLKVEK